MSDPPGHGAGPTGHDGDLAALTEILHEARRLGFLGPGPVQRQIAHARGFAQAVGPAPPRQLLDLGSGGGLPGLVLALTWPTTAVTLLDSSARRTAFLREAVDRLAVGSQVTVVRERAEILGRAAGWRGTMDVVVARGFGPPAVVAECAAPLLRPGGRLVVSEPPGDAGERWPDDGVATLGLHLDQTMTALGGGFAILSLRQPCPEQFPRRPGVPVKRPLF